MAEVVEVKIRQSGGLAGPVKSVPHIVVASDLGIVEDPGDILTATQAAEQAPQRFIGRDGSGLPVLGLLKQAYGLIRS